MTFKHGNANFGTHTQNFSKRVARMHGPDSTLLQLCGSPEFMLPSLFVYWVVHRWRAVARCESQLHKSHGQSISLIVQEKFELGVVKFAEDLSIWIRCLRIFKSVGNSRNV